MALRCTLPCLVSGSGGGVGPTPVYVQDGPPPGGFPDVRLRRAPRKQGSGIGAVLATVSLMAIGFYQVGQGNKHKRAVAAERREMRVAVLPYLQAEENERFMKNHEQVVQEEAEIMQERSDWTAGESVYHSQTLWTPPAAR